ncbi:MAG: hypothetical protein LBH55_03195 [Mycoplasmataceae bacterium]|jgi:hypothetical protein|nr:hypothetical protein [Mycoplasmataceae bacterium]
MVKNDTTSNKHVENTANEKKEEQDYAEYCRRTGGDDYFDDNDDCHCPYSE